MSDFVSITDYNSVDVEDVIALVQDELEFALLNFPPMRSAHEGYAILWEEVDELWDEVKNNKHDDGAKQRKEAIQVAAMAIRFVLDISDKGKHRNER